MSEPIEYGWRTQSVAIARGGFLVTVEKFWCATDEGDASGWRWSAFSVGALREPRKQISNTMSFAEAKAAADAWLTEQLANATNPNVYAFAGAEVAS